MTYSLNPEDLAHFETNRRKVNETYNLGLAQNQYQRTVLGAEKNRQARDLATQYSQMRTQLPGGFASRGLLNSGLYQKALGDLYSQRNNASADLTGRYQEQLGQLDLMRQQSESVRAGGLGDLAQQEAARRATATNIRRALGGY